MDNEVLFHQESESDNYYLILSGKISFRVHPTILCHSNTKKIGKHKVFFKDNNENSKTQEIAEIERSVFHEGQFFGEWGLIYNIPRTTSAVSVGDTVLLAFDRETFDKLIGRTLVKSENDIKSFIFDKIKGFANLSKKQFNTYYREIKKLFPKRNECIFKEGEIAENIYLIYKGKCYIKQKNCKNPILIKDKGDISGLVSFTDNNWYDYSLYSSSNDTVIFKFSVNDYVSSFYQALKEELLPYYWTQLDIINHCKQGRHNFKSFSTDFDYSNRKEKEKSNNLNNTKGLFEIRMKYNIMKRFQTINTHNQFSLSGTNNSQHQNNSPTETSVLFKNNLKKHKNLLNLSNSKISIQKNSISESNVLKKTKTFDSFQKKINRPLVNNIGKNSNKKPKQSVLKLKYRIKNYSNIYLTGLEKTLKDWNDIKSRKLFSSGGFDLPLYSYSSV